MSLPKRSVSAYQLLVRSYEWKISYTIIKAKRLSLSHSSVHRELTTAPKTVKNPLSTNNKVPTVKHLKQLSAKRERAESRIEVHIGYVKQLLKTPKSLRNQVICEAAFLQALRSGEISSLHIEWFNFDSGDYQLLDSKKNEMFTRPMEMIWAKHVMQLIGERTEGILIEPLSNAPHVGRKPRSRTLGLGLSINHLADIVANCCKAAGVPVMNPRVGRAYVATIEHYVLGKPAAYIQWLLRHDNPESTQHYLSRIVCYEDQKALFYQGKEAPFFWSECSRSKVSVEVGGCPLAAPGCRCRMFQTCEVKEPT